MAMEENDILEQLQGSWKLTDSKSVVRIEGSKVTLVDGAGSTTAALELKENLQLKKWQIKTSGQLSWLRTFIVDLTPDNLTLYDFDPKVNIAMAQRSKLLNPTRVFRYLRVPVMAGV